MKIKLNTGRVGNGIVNNPGDIVDVPEAEAARYVQSGQAEYLELAASSEPDDKPRTGRPPKSDR